MIARIRPGASLLAMLGFATLSLPAQESVRILPHAKPRLIVMTDLSNEPDDEESLVRLLVYADQFDIEGLVATTSNWLKQNPREDLIHRDLDAYAQVRTNLARHSPGFPSVADLRAVTRSGQTGYGLAFVGLDKSSGGSRRIVEAVDRADDRPVWVSIWGGPNTLAQALWDVRASRPAAEVESFVAKLRVYAISDQDDSAAWIRREFPGLFYIVTPSNPTSYQEYYRATWSGISGGQDVQTAPGYHAAMVANPWLEANVIRNHGPLGALYPRRLYLMEGDTPSFLGLIDRGLGWDLSPAYGGWGGRYALYQPAGEARPHLDRQRVDLRSCRGGAGSIGELQPSHNLALAGAFSERLRGAHGLVHRRRFQEGQPQPAPGAQRRSLHRRGRGLGPSRLDGGTFRGRNGCRRRRPERESHVVDLPRSRYARGRNADADERTDRQRGAPEHAKAGHRARDPASGG